MISWDPLAPKGVRMISWDPPAPKGERMMSGNKTKILIDRYKQDVQETHLLFFAFGSFCNILCTAGVVEFFGNTNR